MTDARPTTPAATATRDVAVAAARGRARPPFARPTDLRADGRGDCPRPTPFVGPRIVGGRGGEPEPGVAPSAGVRTGDSAAGAVADARRRSGDDAAGVARMVWPAPADLAAAATLDGLARRLRDGSLRLPVAVDPTSPAVVLAATLVALHAASPDVDARSIADAGAVR